MSKKIVDALHAGSEFVYVGSKILPIHSHFRSDAMDIEQQLKKVADRYREQGYQVVLRPGPEDLPPFAKDFKVEIVATRADGGVVASVKARPRISRPTSSFRGMPM